VLVDSPGHVSELRALLQLYADLRAEHVAWAQRVHATCPPRRAQPGRQLSDPEIRARLAGEGTAMVLSPAGAQAVQVALRMLDRLEAELAPVHAQIAGYQDQPSGGPGLTSSAPRVRPFCTNGKRRGMHLRYLRAIRLAIGLSRSHFRSRRRELATC
jgi:hypothetical protein